MEIKTYDYVEGDVSLKVPFDGDTFINATEAYKAFSVKDSAFANFVKRKLTPYAERLIELGKIPTSQNVSSADNQDVTTDQLILVRKGGNDKLNQGTWLHPKLALTFARWLSMDFEIWCDEKIETLMREGYVGITEDITEALKPFNDMIVTAVRSNKYHSKKFGTHVIALLKGLEDAGASYKSLKSVVSHISKHTTTANRLNTYKKLMSAAEATHESGNLSRRTLEDLTHIIYSGEKQTLKHRLTRTSNKLSTSMDRIAVLNDEITKTTKKLEKTGGKLSKKKEENYKEKIEKLQKTLSLFIEAEQNPPLDVEFDRDNISATIGAFNKASSGRKGVRILYNGIAPAHPNPGMASKGGKGTTPDYADEVIGFGFGLWNATTHYSIRLHHGKNLGYKALLQANVMLEFDGEDGSLVRGFFAKNAGERFYFMFDEVTKWLVIYKHTVGLCRKE